jgi:BON domain
MSPRTSPVRPNLDSTSPVSARGVGEPSREDTSDSVVPRVTVPGYPSSEWLEGKGPPVRSDERTPFASLAETNPATPRRSETPAESRNGDSIQREVLLRLDEVASIDAARVLVSVSGGEVILEGRVANREALQEVEALVRGVSGVTRVHNRLEAGKGILSELGERLFGSDSSAEGSETRPSNTGR